MRRQGERILLCMHHSTCYFTLIKMAQYNRTYVMYLVYWDTRTLYMTTNTSQLVVVLNYYPSSIISLHQYQKFWSSSISISFSIESILIKDTKIEFFNAWSAFQLQIIISDTRLKTLNETKLRAQLKSMHELNFRKIWSNTPKAVENPYHFEKFEGL